MRLWYIVVLTCSLNRYFPVLTATAGTHIRVQVKIDASCIKMRMHGRSMTFRICAKYQNIMNWPLTIIVIGKSPIVSSFLPLFDQRKNNGHFLKV